MERGFIVQNKILDGHIAAVNVQAFYLVHKSFKGTASACLAILGCEMSNIICETQM